MVTLCLTFEELPNCFPMWLYHFTFPLAMCEGSSFPTPPPTCGLFLWFSPSSWVCGGSSLWLWVAFLCWLVLSILSCACWPFVDLLQRMSIQILAHFLIGLFVFLLLNYKNSLCILDIGPSSDTWFANILPRLGVVFSLSLIVLFDTQSF